MKKQVRKCIYGLVLTAIARASDAELNEIVQAVIRRYAQQFPDWDVLFLSMPKNDRQERQRSVEALCAFADQSPSV